jgi:tRNA nucleotidyltransferase (CCA-adding enzyme)
MFKLDSEVFRSIFTPELTKIFEIFNKYGYEIRIAGGAVRDLLMNIKPHDIDFATIALPDQMKEIFNKEHIRMLNRNGEKHGTITVRIDDKENYEITTLRIDVHTDGRHAEVQFTNDWKLDANRRDLTINSLFLGQDGTVYDYFNGLEDTLKRRIRFVGEPDERIKEDYLRILRYFRFYGRICESENLHNPKSIDAIRLNAHGLDGIHGERIWIELKKILVGNFADSLVMKMHELGVLAHIGLPSKPNIDEFKLVYDRIKDTQSEISPITMSIALLRTSNELEVLCKRVRFSNDERKLAEFILLHRNCDFNSQEDNYKPYKNILVDNIKDSKIKDKLFQLLYYQGHKDYIEFFNNYDIPVFPINGDLLIAEKGLSRGPIIAEILNALKEIWKNENNFNSDKNCLLKVADNIIVNLKK